MYKINAQTCPPPRHNNLAIKALGRNGLKKNLAFTLAEVLITLGIIGVISALTLPSLIHKYRIKVLETQFKKTSSTIEQAVRATAIEYSMEDYFYPKGFTYGMQIIPDTERTEMNNFFKSQLKTVPTKNLFGQIKNRKIIAKKINGENFGPSYADGYSWVFWNEGVILTDGSMVSMIVYQKHHQSDGVKVYFDTNGPFKGPNRIGYDMFVYDTGYWLDTACPQAIGEYYYYGCYRYALANIAPNDKTKKYWDNLK